MLIDDLVVLAFRLVCMNVQDSPMRVLLLGILFSLIIYKHLFKEFVMTLHHMNGKQMHIGI
jgi:hypothetical protein